VEGEREWRGSGGGEGNHTLGFSQIP